MSCGKNPARSSCCSKNNSRFFFPPRTPSVLSAQQKCLQWMSQFQNNIKTTCTEGSRFNIIGSIYCFIKDILNETDFFTASEWQWRKQWQRYILVSLTWFLIRDQQFYSASIVFVSSVQMAIQRKRKTDLSISVKIVLTS